MITPVRWRLAGWILAILAPCLVHPASTLAQPASPAEPANSAAVDAEIAKLIEQLGSDRFFVREQAQASLAKLGYEAFDALVEAEEHADIEIASRAKYLVRLVKVEWTREGDPPQLKQLLDGYDQLDQPARSERIRQLAINQDPAWIAALCRLVRFERIPTLSKQAAVRLIEQQDVPADAWPARGESIVSQLGRSSRSAAQWLRLYVESQADPAGAVTRWEQLVSAEEKTLAQYPEETDNSILSALARYQIALLERLGRTDAIGAVVARLVAIESGETESLVKLVDWLVQRKAWDGLEKLHARFAGRFEQEPTLAYSLAGAKRSQEDSEGAEKLANQALALNIGDARQHLQIAIWLRDRGWLDWSERELRRVIEIGPADEDNTLSAQFRLADLLHDQQSDEAAGEVLQEAIDSLDKVMRANQQPEFAKAIERAKQLIGSRMHYYLSCHFQRQKDFAKEAEQLALGIKDDPTDADLLIGMYRLPDQSEAQRDETKRMIEDAAKRYRIQIAQNPSESDGYNKLAWLLSNTDRELQEALKASQESLRLRPNEAGYLDTLGRCYFALKDYPNAVKFQQQAVTIEPYSGTMRRQLEVFRKALAEAGSADGKQP